jgi:hypothetical protein
MKIGTLLAALAGGIVMFLLGFLLFGVLLADFFTKNTVQYPGLMKDPPAFWAIFLFNLVWAWLIAWIVERSQASGWAVGAKIGAIALFTIGVGTDLDYLAFMHIYTSITPILVHLIVATILGAVAGAVIGLVMERFGRVPATA